MILAYKAFEKDLSCTSGGSTFHYQEDIWNEEPAADVRKRGLHCAENPLDCLRYYPDMDRALYYLVLADGDINEDGTDSAITCTRMRLVRRLPVKDFVLHALNYMYRYPDRKAGRYVQWEKGESGKWFTIVRGKHPKASGEKGTVLAFAKEAPESSRITELGLYEVDGISIKPGRWYGTDGQEVQDIG